MPHYKDSKSNVFFLDSRAFEHLLPADCVEITDEEADLLRAPSPEALRDQAKASRAAAVAAIDVTVSTGKVFDGDEDSQARMSRAIQIAQITGATSTNWTLADNTVATVTLDELREALALAGQQQAALWPIPEAAA